MTDRPLAQEERVHEEDVVQIENIFTEMEAAFTEHDAVKFDARLTADVIFTAVNGVRFVGWDDIHAYHSERLNHHAEDVTTWFEIEHITFPADGAAVVAVRQPLTTPVGSRINVGTWVLTKKEDLDSTGQRNTPQVVDHDRVGDGTLGQTGDVR